EMEDRFEDEDEGRGRPKSIIARLGSLRWLRECGVAIPDEHSFLKKWGEEGATVIALGIDTRLVSFFALKDAIKSNAAKVVHELQSTRLQIYLITGDNSRTAQSIGRQAGIPAEKVFAEIRPEEKAAIVKRLQSEGQRIAFVG